MGKKGADITQYCLMILGFVGGWFGYSYINSVSEQPGHGFLWIMAVLLVTVAAVAIALSLNIILHEAGHLIGGLLTGYRFVAFCVLNRTIMRENGKLTIKKYSVPGTSGFCVTSPPDMLNGAYPFKLYISGGFLMNFLMCIACFGLFSHLAGTAAFWARAFLVIGIVSAFLGLVNFIPVSANGVFSDGYALFYMGKEKNALACQGCWSLFRFYAFDTEGIRPCDIPVELIDWVDIGDINNIFVLSTALNQYKYLLDRQDMDKARTLIQALHDHLPSVFETQKMSCRCELLFHELIGECRQAEMKQLFTEELQAYLKSAHSDFSVHRIMYAYERLVLKDAAKANKHLALFHKVCASSIWAGTVLSEQTLIAFIDKIADEREVFT